MTTVYDPFGSAEFAVEIRDGKTLIGRTEPTRDADEAKQALHKLAYAYPDSGMAWRSHPHSEWEALDEGALDRMVYQRTAVLVSSLIGEGLAKVNWSLSSTNPTQVDGHLVRAEDSREAIAAYAVLLGCEVSESPHLDDRVKVSAEGAYQGLTVLVWDLVAVELPAAVSA